MTSTVAESQKLVIDPLVRLWNSEVRPHVMTNACVLSARIASEVLGYFGIKHEVIPMAAMVVNDKMLNHQMDEIPHELWDADAWSVGVGFGEKMVATNKDYRSKDGFDGHTVVLTEEFYIDLTAYQFDRIEHGIDTGGSLVVPMTDITYPFRITENDSQTWAYFKIKEGHVLAVNNGNHLYKKSLDWRNHYKIQSGEIIRQIRDEISL